jgi:hypothetical protein
MESQSFNISIISQCGLKAYGGRGRGKIRLKVRLRDRFATQFIPLIFGLGFFKTAPDPVIAGMERDPGS